MIVLLPFPEIAQQREKRLDLATGERPVSAVDVRASLRSSELFDGVQVDAPVASADDKAREPLVFQNPACRVGLEIRADWDAGFQPPRGRADAHEVIVARAGFVRDLDLAYRPSELRGDHPEQVAVQVLKRDGREALGPARVGELDRGLVHLATALAEDI